MEEAFFTISVIFFFQIQFTELVDLPEVNKPVGVNILLSAAEGEIVQVINKRLFKFSTR